MSVFDNIPVERDNTSVEREDTVRDNTSVERDNIPVEREDTVERDNTSVEREDKREKLEQWRKDNIFLKNSSPETPYKRRVGEKKEAIHWGQRKLHICEQYFITSEANKLGKDKHMHIIYAGAAPGSHILLLLEMFPDTMFYLYDTAIFNNQLKSHPRVRIYSSYFTDETAQAWSEFSENNQLYFISDIRTANYTTMEIEENEKHIVEDLRMQERWVRIIKPVASLLKFRLPYPQPSLASSSSPAKDEKFKYLRGEILRQAWAPQTSTETRLIVSGPLRDKNWSIKSYESKMFHHNFHTREKQSFIFSEVSYSSKDWNISSPELLKDYDSCFEAQVHLHYLNLLLMKKVISPAMEILIGEEMKIMRKINIRLKHDNPNISVNNEKGNLKQYRIQCVKKLSKLLTKTLSKVDTLSGFRESDVKSTTKRSSLRKSLNSES